MGHEQEYGELCFYFHVLFVYLSPFNRCQSVIMVGLSCAIDNHCGGDEQMDLEILTTWKIAKLRCLPEIQPDFDVNQCVICAEVTGEKLSSVSTEVVLEKLKEFCS